MVFDKLFAGIDQFGFRLVIDCRYIFIQGLATLDDLKENGNLNHQQLVGLKYYDEFLDRMPRIEAEEIGKVVMEATQFISPGLCSVVCGSFRRGKPTCGDVDVLVSHPDGHSHKDVMPQLLKRLKETG